MLTGKELLTRSANYHGQALTNFLQDSQPSALIDLAGIDYERFRRRQDQGQLSHEDRGRRILLHRFIAQKSPALFADRPEKGVVVLEDDEAHFLPAIETFLVDDLSKEDRIKHFFSLVRYHEVLFATILAKNSSGFLLRVNSYENCKLTLDDLNIKAFCPAAEAVFTSSASG